MLLYNVVHMMVIVSLCMSKILSFLSSSMFLKYLFIDRWLLNPYKITRL